MQEEYNLKKDVEKKIKKHSKNEEQVKLEQALAEANERAMRIQAEMMNFRKRSDEAQAQFKKYCNEDILSKLIGVVDNFERALALENEENKEFLKGFHMIYTSIINILNENEVKEINAQDQEFDPVYHQAVLTEKVEGLQEGIVIDVLQKGYTYKDRVLRPAMVKVSE